MTTPEEAPLIDFLYVDKNRVFDLVSQINRGLNTKRTHQDTVANHTKEQKSSTTKVKGATKAGADVPLIAELAVKGELSSTDKSGHEHGENNSNTLHEELDFSHLHKVDILHLLKSSGRVKTLAEIDSPVPGNIILAGGDLELFDTSVINSILGITLRKLVPENKTDQAFGELGDLQFPPQIQNSKDVVRAFKKLTDAFNNADKIKDDIKKEILSIANLITEIEAILPKVAIIKIRDEVSELQFSGPVKRENFVEQLPILMTKFGNQLGDGWKVLAIVDKLPVGDSRLEELVAIFLQIGNLGGGSLSEIGEFQELLSSLSVAISEAWGLTPLLLTGDYSEYYSFTPILVYREIG